MLVADNVPILCHNMADEIARDLDHPLRHNSVVQMPVQVDMLHDNKLANETLEVFLKAPLSCISLGFSTKMSSHQIVLPCTPSPGVSRLLPPFVYLLCLSVLLLNISYCYLSIISTSLCCIQKLRNSISFQILLWLCKHFYNYDF